MKTISLKKVSAVAVASLGFGLLSVVPAQAALSTADAVTSISLAKVTASPETGTAVDINFGALMSADWVGTTRFVAAITSAPANGAVAVLGVIDANGTTELGTSDALATGGVVVTDPTVALNVTATSALGNASFRFTPAKAGTYEVTVWNDAGTSPDGILTSLEARSSISITVAALAGLSTTLSTIRMAAAETAAAGTNLVSTSYTTTTNAVQRAAYKTTGTAIAEIEAILVDIDGSTASAGHTLSCQVTGAGFCEVGDSVGEEATTAVTLRSDSKALAGNQGYVTIVSDGTVGTGSVEIKVTDAVTEAVTVLGTRSWYSFGDVTTLTVTQILKIGKSGGGAVGYSGATRSATNIAATVVKATDSLGQAANITGGGVPTLVPTDVTVSSGGTCVKDDGSVPTTYSPGLGFGFYNCDLATPSSAVSGKSTATIARIVSPADATLYIKSAEFTTSVGGSISSAKETLSFDKTSYAPGEAMIVTRTAVDSSGNPVWDGSLSPAVTFSKAVGGSGGGAGAYVAGKSATSTTLAGATVFAPVSPGAFTGIMTGGATGAATNGITASATVTDANAGLLTQIDALNAKIVALNALIAKIMKKLGVK